MEKDLTTTFFVIISKVKRLHQFVEYLYQICSLLRQKEHIVLINLLAPGSILQGAAF